MEEEEQVEAAAVVWTVGVRVNPLVEKLPLEKDRRNLIVVEPTLQARGRENVFALSNAASYPELERPRLAGASQLAFQQARLAAANIPRYSKASRSGPEDLRRWANRSALASIMRRCSRAGA